MTDPTTIGKTDAVAQLNRILHRRGMTVPTGPIDDAPTPDEPGHPDYHHRQRVTSALAKLEVVTPPLYAQARTDHPDVCAWADQVAASPEGAGHLLLWGGTGTGKTHHAYGIARRIAETGPRRFGFFATTFPDLYAALRPPAPDTERDHMMRRVTTIPLLLLDDLGTTKDSAWTEETTYRIINTRYNERRPTIITTNHPPVELQELVGDRIASRLIGMTTRIHMDGEDRRLN